MLDEFPALGRLDFFEMRARLHGGLRPQELSDRPVAQPDREGLRPEQLDPRQLPCARVSFATNDERTAKRVSDALGTATEMRAMKNYAGHRLSPWLGHLMVSRQETARPLLTPGEVMQLPPDRRDRAGSGCPPIRAKKVRYYEDQQTYGSNSSTAETDESDAGAGGQGRRLEWVGTAGKGRGKRTAFGRGASRRSCQWRHPARA